MVQLIPVSKKLLGVPVRAGGEDFRFLLDLAGGQTIIDDELADQLACKPGGRGLVYKAEGVRFDFSYCPDVTLEIGGRAFHFDEIGTTNIHRIWPPELPPINGVLALDAFRDQPFTLSLDSAVLTLESDASLRRRVRKMTELQVRIATGVDGRSVMALTRVNVNGTTGWFVLDNNQMLPIFVDETILPPPDSGSTDKQVIQFQVAGMEKFPTFGISKPLIYDGLLNDEILRRWELTVDLRKGALWAKRLPRNSDKLFDF